jgi:hypothetical protein
MKDLITFVLKYLPYLITASKSVPQITSFIAGLKEIFSRKKLWTKEQEEQFDAETEALRSDPYWKVND